MLDKEKDITKIGAGFGDGLRETSQYTTTQEALITRGLVAEVLNQTPPVGLNLKILTEQMPEAMQLLDQLPNNSTIALFGLAIADGVNDTFRLLHQLGRQDVAMMHVVDIDQAIIEQVKELKLANVLTLHEDASRTSLDGNSHELIVRDHLGNCCPPDLYHDIEREVARVLVADGFALVNITTSESLLQSEGRECVHIDQLSKQLSQEVLKALRSRIFSLSQLSEEFPNIKIENLRGKLLEISPNCFVVFGEDEQGHGEWFSTLEWQESLWTKNGFKVVASHKRVGQDSHKPPLECVRHIVLLRKIKEEK
ncbi:MAG: hypothetical protein ABFQ62_01090 [Patescibacteria group bacterium]